MMFMKSPNPLYDTAEIFIAKAGDIPVHIVNI